MHAVAPWAAGIPGPLSQAGLPRLYAGRLMPEVPDSCFGRGNLLGQEQFTAYSQVLLASSSHECYCQVILARCYIEQEPNRLPDTPE